jgi:hypothetical protein
LFADQTASRSEQRLPESNSSVVVVTLIVAADAAPGRLSIARAIASTSATRCRLRMYVFDSELI